MSVCGFRCRCCLRRSSCSIAIVAIVLTRAVGVAADVAVDVTVAAAAALAGGACVY